MLEEVSSSCEIKTTGKTNREEDKEGQSERRGREGKANAEGAGEKPTQRAQGKSNAEGAMGEARQHCLMDG
jgi:hypothetical protein